MGANARKFTDEMLAEYDRNVRRAQVRLVSRVALFILNTARRNSRVRTGFMVSRWGISVSRLNMRNTGAIAIANLDPANAFDDVFVHNDADYVSFHEFGTVYISPQPMLAPGVQAVENWQEFAGGDLDVADPEAFLGLNLGPLFGVRPAA